LRLENELSEATSRKVDIVKYGDIKSTIKERILGQAINIL
jgi:predicted nucleotidyltransferase